MGILTAAALALPAFAADDGSGLRELRWGKNAFTSRGCHRDHTVEQLDRLPNGKANARRLVGEYNNPILTPEAAAVVKQRGELAISGKGFPNAYDQCRLITPPSTFAMQLTFAMLPLKNGDIVIVYDQNMNFRHIRMNSTPPAKILSSQLWAIRSAIGKATPLVVDTVGIQTDVFPDRPFRHAAE